MGTARQRSALEVRGPGHHGSLRVSGTASSPPLTSPQVAKFAIYWAVPVALTFTFVGMPENMQRVIANVRCLQRLMRASQRPTLQQALTM